MFHVLSTAQFKKMYLPVLVSYLVGIASSLREVR